MSSLVETTVEEDPGSIGLQDKPSDEHWREDSDSQLDSFITVDRKIIPAIVSDIRSDDRRTRLIATTKIRRLLQCRPANVVVQPVIDSGLVPTVIEMLSVDDNKLRAEAAWIVSNIVSGTSEQTATVVEAGAIPKLVAMLPTDVTSVQENVLWALEDIGADCEEFRDMVVEAGGIQALLDVLDAPEKYTEKVQNTASWALNFYLTTRYAELGLDVMSQMIPILAKFLRGAPDNSNYETLRYAVHALDEICANDEAAELTITTGILPRLVEFCAKDGADLSHHAVSCVGRFTAGSSTDAVIAAGFLEALKPCISHRLVKIRLVTVARDKQEVPVTRKHVIRTLANLVDMVLIDPELVDPLIVGGCVEAFSGAMATHDALTQRFAVRSLRTLLGGGSRNQGKISELFKAAGGIARLRALRDENDTRGSEVGMTAHEILRKHYPNFAQRPRV
ncbi:hypothetical protein FS837_004849 [Tulasnella sp. UAMH 9824]|nr:hypothetical protein FS837_004849 [Tulasnella sp. UAMH 9824]